MGGWERWQAGIIVPLMAKEKERKMAAKVLTRGILQSMWSGPELGVRPRDTSSGRRH